MAGQARQVAMTGVGSWQGTIARLVWDEEDEREEQVVHTKKLY